LKEVIVGEYASRGQSFDHSSSSASYRAQPEVVRTPSERADDAIHAVARDVASTTHAVDQLKAASSANDPAAWHEARARVDRELQSCAQLIERAHAHTNDATPRTAAELAGYARTLDEAKAAAATLVEPPRGWRPSSREAEILAVLRAPIVGTAKAGNEQKEQALRAELVQLDPAESAALATRLRKAESGDPIAAEISRMIPERRARMLTVLGDARRRAAIQSARQPAAAPNRAAPSELALSSPVSTTAGGQTVGAVMQATEPAFQPLGPTPVSNAPTNGRMGETWPVTIPEQVVGSTHGFEFAAPRNLSALDAIGVVTVDGSTELHADWAPIKFPGMGDGPMKLTFSPTSAGEHHATLIFVMKWDDGHVERRSIQVNARARKLDDVPASSTPLVSPQHSKSPNAPKSPDRPLMVDVANGWLNADLTFASLTKEQADGVDLVATESKEFKPMPAERSLWQDLAEIAFQLGTGAVAGLVTRFVTSRVASAIVGAEHVATAAEKGEEAIAAAEKAAGAAKGDVVEEREANQRVVAAKVGNYANADAARHAKFAQGEIGSAVGMAVSTAITKTANEIHGAQSAPGGATSGKTTGTTTTTETSTTTPRPAASADGRIAFFSEQTSMIGALASAGGRQLNGVLAEQIKQHPDIANDLIQGVMEGLDEAKTDAKERQAATTSAQFMTYVARTNLGTQKLDTPAGQQTVTDMTEQRGHGDSLLEPASLASGVLEIVCDYQRGQVRVVDARAQNVSWLVANRLLDKPLVKSGIPMRVSLHGGGTIITRDEAGRVRVSGTLELAAPGGEEQQVREAERILDVVFAKSLADWGVPQIHTDDATQGPDPKKESKKP
jgi:hypothetical protein